MSETAALPLPGEDLAPESLPSRPLAHHLALTIYWLSNTLMWGALLHLGLQTRLGDWFGEARVGYYFAILGFAGGLVGSATQVIVGAFSDRSLHRWGRRRVYVLAGSMLGSVGLLLLGAAHSFWPFAGALVLVQLFSNTALGPFTALLPDTVNPREHGKASGFMGVARLLGDTGGILLAGQLLSTGHLVGAPPEQIAGYHDRQMLLMCGLLAAFLLVTMTLTCLTVKERPLRHRPNAGTWETVVGSFNVDVRGNADFFWLTLSRAVTNLGFYMFLMIIPFFAKYSLRSPDPERTTMLLQLPGIGAAAISSIISGLVSDRLGRKVLILLAQFIMALAALGFALAHSNTLAFIAIVPGGLAYGVFTAVEWALACNLLPRGASARYLGVWNISAVVPQIMAVGIAGGVGSALSARTPGLGWRVDFLLVLVACLGGAWILRFVHERPAPAPLDPEEPGAVTP